MPAFSLALAASSYRLSMDDVRTPQTTRATRDVPQTLARTALP